MKHVDVKSGKWYRISKDDQITCCDCGLVHRVNFKATADTKARNMKLFIRFYRDDKQTTAVRKKRWTPERREKK